MYNKIINCFICFCIYLSSLATFPPLQACENDTLEEGKETLKRKMESLGSEQSKRQRLTLENVPLPCQESPLLNLPDDTLRNIVAFLPLPEAVRAEVICKQFFNCLRKSVQYRALIAGWDIPNLGINNSPRSIFRFMKGILEFQVHLADLWRNYFPLGLKNQELPLTYYWETYLDLENAPLGESLNSIYKSYLINKFVPKKLEYRQRAELGKNITGQKNRLTGYENLATLLTKQDYLPHILDEAFVESTLMKMVGKIEEQPDYVNIRTRLTAILKSLDVDNLTKVKAQWAIATMDRLGQGILQPDFANARTYYLAILNNPAVDPQTNAMTQLGIAEMDRLGQGILQSDFENASTHYWAILNNPAVDPQTNAMAQLSVAEMDRLGQGILEPDFENARIYYLTILNNPVINPQLKSKAQLWMAEMDRFGQGLLQPNFANARIYCLAVLNNPVASPHIKSRAQFNMAEMDRLGQGILQPDFASARIYYLAVLNNLVVNPQIKSRAQFNIAEMDRLGQGSVQPDFASARLYYSAILNDLAADQQIKAMAQFGMEAMQ